MIPQIICIDKFVWEFAVVELAKLNPNAIFCLHRFDGHDRVFAIAAQAIIARPEIAGASVERLIELIENQ